MLDSTIVASEELHRITKATIIVAAVIAKGQHYNLADKAAEVVTRVIAVIVKHILAAIQPTTATAKVQLTIIVIEDDCCRYSQ